MIRTRGVATWLSVALAAALAFGIACGDGDDEPEPEPTPNAEETAAASEVSAEDIIPLYEASAVFIVADGFYGGAGSGTGIVLDDEGHVLTNNHVIDGAASLVVRHPESGRDIQAQIVGRSPCDDLAVIKLRDPEGFKPAPLGDLSELRQGSQVYAVGFPGTPDQDFNDTELSITGGLVSKLDAQFDYYGLQNTIQTDTALNHGNSGGPLIDKSGKVVGVNTLGFSSSGLENVNYAIAIDEARLVYEQLLDGKDLNWIGINIEPNYPEYEEQYGIPYYEDSAVIFGVDTNSPLRQDDWLPGDLILAAEGKIVRTPGDLCSVLRSHRPGDKILIEGYGVFVDDAGGEYYDLYESELTLP